MGSATKATSRRSPPSSLRTQKGLPRVSPAWRLRTRSCSHDNELYRMGLRKNAAGEWGAIDNLLTAGLAAAMRAMRIRSKRRSMIRQSRSMRSSEIRSETEPVADSTTEVDVKVGHFEDVREDADESVVDLTDSTAVFEEIKVYLDLDAEVEGGYVYVNEDGVTVETVLTSVETAKAEFKVEVTGDFEADMSSDHAKPLTMNRGSLASHVEGNEEDGQAIRQAEPLSTADEEAEFPRKRARRSVATACKRCRKKKIRCSGQKDGGGPCLNCETARMENCEISRVRAQELHFAEPSHLDPISIVRNALAEPVPGMPLQCGRCRAWNLQCSGQGQGGGCQMCEDAGVNNCRFNGVQVEALHFAKPFNTFCGFLATPLEPPTQAGTSNFAKASLVFSTFGHSPIQTTAPSAFYNTTRSDKSRPSGDASMEPQNRYMWN